MAYTLKYNTIISHHHHNITNYGFKSSHTVKATMFWQCQKINIITFTNSTLIVGYCIRLHYIVQVLVQVCDIVSIVWFGQMAYKRKFPE